MEIIGQLVKLRDEGKLPIPWYSRGHLGLESGSSACVAFTNPGENLVPDIMVSPYQLQNLYRIFFVSITGKDEAGFISRVQERFKPHNIIHSESVTTEGRLHHRINIVFEVVEKTTDPRSIFVPFLEQLQTHFGADSVREIDPPFELQEGYHHIFDYRVNEGQIALGDWQTKIRQICSSKNVDLSQYDLSRLVISSNTECRFIRYVIPRIGTFQIRVPHRNEPGAAHRITKELAGLGLNILSHRISPTQPEHFSSDVSTLVLICEPVEPSNATDVHKLLQEKLLEPEIQRESGVNEATVSQGVPSVKSLYVFPRGFRGIRMPEDLRQYREIYMRQIANQSVTKAKKKIFISHKFFNSPDKQAILQALKKAINDAGCYWLEAPVDPGQAKTYHPIHARLWMADAAVILAMEDENSGNFSVNQAHEIGFMQGQRKPIRIIVSEDNFFDAKRLSNVPDTTMFVYKAISELTNETDPNSLKNKIDAWVNGETELEWDWLNQL